jgi:hypothetical protein
MGQQADHPPDQHLKPPRTDNRLVCAPLLCADALFLCDGLVLLEVYDAVRLALRLRRAPQPQSCVCAYVQL